jgi:hypothetical protein
MINYYDQLSNKNMQDRSRSTSKEKNGSSFSRSRSKDLGNSRGSIGKSTLPESELYDESEHRRVKMHKLKELMVDELERAKNDGGLDPDFETLEKHHKGYPTFMKGNETPERMLEDNHNTNLKAMLKERVENFDKASKEDSYDSAEDNYLPDSPTRSQLITQSKMYHIVTDQPIATPNKVSEKLFDFHQRKAKEIRRLQYAAAVGKKNDDKLKPIYHAVWIKAQDEPIPALLGTRGNVSNEAQDTLTITEDDKIKVKPDKDNKCKLGDFDGKIKKRRPDEPDCDFVAETADGTRYPVWINLKEKPVDQTPAQEVTEEKPVEQTPAQEVTEEKPVEQTPAQEVTEEKPVEQTPAQEVTEEKPVEQTPAQEVTEEKPVEQTPAQEVTEEKPVEQTPAQEVTEENPVEKVQASPKRAPRSRELANTNCTLYDPEGKKKLGRAFAELIGKDSISGNDVAFMKGVLVDSNNNLSLVLFKRLSPEECIVKKSSGDQTLEDIIDEAEVKELGPKARKVVIKKTEEDTGSWDKEVYFFDGAIAIEKLRIFDDEFIKVPCENTIDYQARPSGEKRRTVSRILTPKKVTCTFFTKISWAKKTPSESSLILTTTTNLNTLR